MEQKRNYSLLDKFCINVDQMIRTMFNNVKGTGSAYPAKITEENLSDKQRQHSAAIMRINHAGEVCAQALYQGQALVSRKPHIQQKLEQAALEEGDHLYWCSKRLDELNSHPSYLNPLWYTGSFCIGLVAGVVGDDWSLGFVAETELQVYKHLENQMQLLPLQDQRSYQILEKMQQDENKHREDALAAGAKELPNLVKKGMSFASMIMVKTAYWV